MKLINDFFHIVHTDNREEEIEVALRLNAEHTIFRAHFPGQPIMPGVCQVAMLVETLETIEGKALQLTAAKNIKFLSVISPDSVTDVVAVFGRIRRTEADITFSVVLRSGETTFSKLSLTCSYAHTDE